jgi:ketosteroid isomerase-like protein
MTKRWLLLGALPLSLLCVGCFSAGAMVAGQQTIGVTTQLSVTRSAVSNDERQLALITSQLNAQRPLVDEYEVKQIEVEYHQALATKDLDLMMSIFDDHAVLTGPTGTVYTGAAAIRTFYATQAPAMQPQNHWAALVPSYKMKTSIAGDTAALTFECHMVDVATGRIMVDHQIDITAAREGSKWLVTNMKATAIQLS